jgi:hypothetical protein
LAIGHGIGMASGYNEYTGIARISFKVCLGSKAGDQADAGDYKKDGTVGMGGGSAFLKIVLVVFCKK